MPDYDVAIVGLGPVAACLGNLLGAAGVRVLILERAHQTYPLPRAVHFDDETMRVFQAAGCAAQIAPTLTINPGMQFVSKEGAMLLDWPRPQVITPNGWYASYRFHQPEIEGCLVDGLARYPNVRVRRGATVTGVADTEGEEHATVQFTVPDGSVRPDLHAAFPDEVCDGRTETITAMFVVGCDGANSGTRRAIGINHAVAIGVPRLVAQDAAGENWEDLGFQERWLVVDVKLLRPMDELGSHTRQTCDPERPSTYTRQPGNRRRWEMKILDGESDEQVSDAAWVQAFLMRPQAGRPAVTPQDATVERIAVYTFHSKVAETWRSGRLMLAGDACHLTPPFMGQGMCAGIRDASNLGWKLALCVRGGKGQMPLPQSQVDVLLDSYQTERRPHVREYVETAMRLGALMNTCQTAEQLKNTLQPPKPETEGAKMKSIKPPLGPGLGVESSPLRTLMCRQLQGGDERPGLDGGLDDRLGYAFVLLVDAAFLATHRAWAQPQLDELGLTVLTTEARGVAECLAENSVQQGALLVRPDRYFVGGASDRAGLEALLAAAWPNLQNATPPRRSHRDASYA